MSFVVRDEFGEYKVSYDVEELNFWGVALEAIPAELGRCGRLRELDLSGSGVRLIRHLEALPLEALKLDGCRLSFLAGLPRGLQTLSATHNSIAAVRLPRSLEELYLSANRLHEVPRGPCLRALHVGGNPIPFLEGFSKGLRELEISLESARAISLPDSLEVLLLHGPRGSDEVHAELLAELPAGLREVRYEACDYTLPVDEAIRSGVWRAPLPADQPDAALLPFEQPAPRPSQPTPPAPMK